MAKDSLVRVLKCERFEAEIVKGLLESEGIQAMIMDNTMGAVLSTYSYMAGAVSIMVNAQDEQRAQQILKERES